MDVHEKLRSLLRARGWTEYRLAKESGLSESTIANIFRRRTVPSVTTLAAICGGFGITPAQFFAEEETVELTTERKELFESRKTLTPQQKEAVRLLLKSMNS